MRDSCYRTRTIQKQTQDLRTDFIPDMFELAARSGDLSVVHKVWALMSEGGTLPMAI